MAEQDVSLYRRAGGVSFLDYPQELLCADANHKWGESPFHYTKSLYLHTLKHLDVLFP